MIWETLGWTLDHPIWSAIILTIVAGTVVFALPVVGRSNK